MKSGSIQPPSGHFQDSDNRGSRDGEIMHSEEAEMVGPFSRPQGGSDDPPLDIAGNGYPRDNTEGVLTAISARMRGSVAQEAVYPCLLGLKTRTDVRTTLGSLEGPPISSS